MESDHMPLEITLRGPENLIEATERQAKIREELQITKWGKEEIVKYRGRTQMMSFKGKAVDEKMRELTEWIGGATEKKKILKRDKRNSWWDKECRELNRQARGQLRKWRQNKTTKEEYMQAKNNYRVVRKRNRVRRKKKRRILRK